MLVFASLAMLAAAAGAPSAPLKTEFLVDAAKIQALSAAATRAGSRVDCSQVGAPEIAQRCADSARIAAAAPDGVVVSRQVPCGARACPVAGSAVRDGDRIVLSYKTCSTVRPGFFAPQSMRLMTVAWRVNGAADDATFVFAPPENAGQCPGGAGSR